MNNPNNPNNKPNNQFTIRNWNIEELTGYKPLTTFYTDFSIADKFIAVEPNAIHDTYERALRYAKTDYKLLTELVMVLSWKSFEHQDNPNPKVCREYSSLYYDLDEYALDTLKGDELSYYISTTD